MREIERILAIPTTKPTIKSLEIRRAFTDGKLSANDIKLLREDWEWTCVTYIFEGAQYTYHTNFPLD